MTLGQENLTTALQSESSEDKTLAYQGTSLRSFLNSDYNTQEDIKNAYSDWVAEPLYLSFQETKTEYYRGIESSTRKYSFSLASKRGNEIYNKRCISRFNETDSKIPDIQYFDRNNKHEIKTTQSLFITLTYNPDKVSQSDAWLGIGKDFNLFLAKLRESYGSGISQIRAWESHESGYPHIHCLLYFSKISFHVHWHTSKNSNWRLERKTKDKISGLWAGGFTDIFGVYDSKKAFHYLGKYLYKYLTSQSEKGILTRALTWYYRKRAFSLSTAFYPDLKTRSITKILRYKQITIEGDKLTIYDLTFLGCVVILDVSKKKVETWLSYNENKLPDQIKDEVLELERKLSEDHSITHQSFAKIETGSVMSIEQVKSFFLPFGNTEKEE